MNNDYKKLRILSRSDNAIPNYDYLFNEASGKTLNSKTRFFKNLVKLNFWPIIWSTIVYLFQALPTWTTPIFTANIIDIATKAVEHGVTNGTWRGIIINALLLFACLIFNIPTTILRWKIVSKMLRSTSAGIKSSVVRKLQSLSITYHKDMRTGKIQSKFLRDTDSIDSLFNMLLQSFIPNIIGVIVSCIISFYKNGFVALFFLLVIPCNIGLTMLFRKPINNTSHDYRVNAENMSTRLTNMLDMLQVTKAHGLEQTEINTVENAIDKVKGSGLKLDRVISRFGAGMWVSNMVLSSVCLVFCSIMAILGKISIGDIVLYQSMFSSISGYVSSLVNMIPSIATGFEALSSVSEIMNTNDIEVNIGKKPIKSINGNVSFDNVYYKYPNTENYVISDLNLDVRSGECIAFVGASGSGKSTIMNIIIGLLTPTSGRVLIDGKPLADYNLSEYRHNISVVPQNSILFAGTIKENITYGLPHYTDEELDKVVKMANLTEFLETLPNGLDTQIGEHGDKLSGGQKQRITIARALIRNPKILVLDEATSALDNISEYQVQKAISSSIQGRTTFIVAHRLSTIRNADRIIVMENGIAIEQGNYDELMAKKGKFYELKSLNDMNLKNAEEALS